MLDETGQLGRLVRVFERAPTRLCLPPAGSGV